MSDEKKTLYERLGGYDAITALIFDQVFVESLRLRKGVNESTRDLVDRLTVRKHRPVAARLYERENCCKPHHTLRVLELCCALRCFVISIANLTS